MLRLLHGSGNGRILQIKNTLNFSARETFQVRFHETADMLFRSLHILAASRLRRDLVFL
jgi:hypothetical protein